MLAEAQILTYTVEDNDRIINGITYNRKHRDNEGQVYLQAEDREDGHNHKCVMEQCHNRRNGEPPFKTDTYINDNP
ncbi:hypothetical protein D3C75_1065890 [compost metagenome]